VLTTATIVYLASLPFGFMSYRNHQRRDVSVPAQQPAAGPSHDATAAVASPSAHSEPPADRERPARLN
jgi:CDP-diacylglycerol---serine O-phosphatidyltransferase